MWRHYAVYDNVFESLLEAIADLWPPKSACYKENLYTYEHLTVYYYIVYL